MKSSSIALTLRISCGSPLNGSDNTVVCSTAADVPIHPPHDLVFSGSCVAVQKCDRRHDHARRAISALECFFFEKSLLLRMQFTISCQAFDGGYFFACGSFC